MPLTEAQIVRYSRQILLKDVGGVGQQKLLDAEVRAGGSGAALKTAVAYVAAAGSTVTVPTADAAWQSASFPLPHAAEVASREAPRVDVLRGPGGIVVRLCGTAIVFAECERCVELHVASKSGRSEVPAHLADLVGATAALVHQRLVLGIGERRGVIAISEEGGWSTAALPACVECGR